MPSAKTDCNGLRDAVSIRQIFKRWSGRSCTISHEDASLHCDGTDYPCTATDRPDRSCAISHEDACLVMWRPRFSGYGTRPLGFQGNALQAQCFSIAELIYLQVQGHLHIGFYKNHVFNKQRASWNLVVVSIIACNLIHKWDTTFVKIYSWRTVGRTEYVLVACIT